MQQSENIDHRILFQSKFCREKFESGQVRHSARVLVIDSDGKIFLFAAHDPSNPERRFWFTPGGGIESGESYKDAARREIFEETGVEIPIDTISVPVLRRFAVVDLASGTRYHYEHFYVYRWPYQAAKTQFINKNKQQITEVENNALDNFAWWDLEDLAARVNSKEVEVYPECLPRLLQLLKGKEKEITPIDTRNMNSILSSESFPSQTQNNGLRYFTDECYLVEDRLSTDGKRIPGVINKIAFH